jgi:hypothetical protein
LDENTNESDILFNEEYLENFKSNSFVTLFNSENKREFINK